MVKGFDKFKQYFAPHSDSFVVIGGTAMQLHGREGGGPVPRVTQDIDILVIVEQMSESFTSAFHAFLREGEWQNVLDSLGDPTGNMEDYILAFRRHFAL